MLEDRLWLTPNTQLSKGQAANIMAHLANKYAAGRPAGMLTNASDLKTLSSLCELAELIEAKRKDLLQSDATGADALQDAEPQGPVVQSSGMLEGLEDDEPAGKKRQKRRTPGTRTAADDRSTTATASSSLATASQASSVPMLQLTDAAGELGSQKSGGSKKDSKKMTEVQACLESLDTDMRRVAEFHYGNSSRTKNLSIKCLVNLVPTKFMGGLDAAKGQSITSATCTQKEQDSK